MASSPEVQTGLIVRTKLNRPLLPPDLVPRARLTDLLQGNPERSLTLVSAPAGYGKSTLVSRWLETEGVNGAWLSVDDEENDPREFLKYLVAAVRTHSPRACRRTYDLLGAAEIPPPAVVGEYLADDLQAIKRRFILVVDDYHRIHERAIHDVLDQVLRHPPRSLHLALVTRHDPPLSLGALRAKGWMTEVRERDLRFTLEETRTVVQVAGGVSIGGDALANLHAGLEGWIVGLRLICLTLRDQTNPEASLARLGKVMPSVQDYLVEEVLARLPPELRAGLLETSILDRFCAPLCEAICSNVSGAGGITGEQLLRDLESANLFVMRLDPGGEWFRYHHLFQELLRRLLDRHASPEKIRTLHGRASRWFASQNLVEEALEHALEAGEADRAADIVEAHRLEILNADRWPVLAGWLSRLPEEVVWQRPELLLGEAWLAYYRFSVPALTRIVERLDVLIGKGGDQSAREGELSLFKSYLYYWQGQGKAQEMLAHAERAQRLLPPTHDLMRADSEIYFGLAHQLAGRTEVGVAALTGRLREHQEQKGLLVTRQIITLAFVHMLAGGIKEGAVYSRQLGELAKSTSPVYIRSWSTYLLGCCHFQSGAWEKAEDCFTWIVENRYVSHTAAALSSFVGLGLTLQFLGRSEEAAEVARRLLAFAAETRDPGNLAIAESGQARIGLLQGDAGGACPSSGATGMATAFLFLEAPEVTRCRLLVAGGSGEGAAQAMPSIELLKEETAALHNTFHLIDLVALEAVAWHLLKKHDKASAALEHALELAEPGAWVRPFAELGPAMAGLLTDAGKRGRRRQVEQILGSLAPASTIPQSQSDRPYFDPLTNRELDVLELLAERMYDKEIAAELHISTATVKTHLRHIYEKLAVGNRRQAVHRAEQLGLLQ